ncbi:MAG: Hpt domain-containing protein [Desulfobacterota bacterium]|jgi:HPt (histidine-containing phosphotransfer) domain-containing protein|nr:Hpt domain-containing protein [Thermodesulfobacteriota bacterium]
MDLQELMMHLDYGKETNLRILDAFIHTGLADLGAIEVAIKEGDSVRVATVAHSLKGAAGALGVVEFLQHARRIEEESLRGNLEGVGDWVQELKEKTQRIAELAEQYRAMP